MHWSWMDGNGNSCEPVADREHRLFRQTLIRLHEEDKMDVSMVFVNESGRLWLLGSRFIGSVVCVFFQRGSRCGDTWAAPLVLGRHSSGTTQAADCVLSIRVWESPSTSSPPCWSVQGPRAVAGHCTTSPIRTAVNTRVVMILFAQALCSFKGLWYSLWRNGFWEVYK